jgi:uncharacterized protein (DUF362 family)
VNDAPGKTSLGPKRLSRRAFVRLALLGGIGASAALLEKVTQPVGAVNFTRWLIRGRLAPILGPPAVVGLGQCAGYSDDLLGCLRETWLAAEMPDVRDKRVLVKPNLIDVIEGHPANTAPEMVGAVVDLLTELGAASVVVGDGPGFRRDAFPLLVETGLDAILARRKVRFVDLNYDDPQPVTAPGEWFRDLREIFLPRHAVEADLIVSLPKLKTHHWAGVTLSLKNLFGLAPGMCYGWPKNMLHFNGIPMSIMGLYEAAAPVVSVVDGIVGMEGDGPLFGSPVPHGLIAVGKDPVAVDVTCAQLMGFDPNAIDHLWLATWTGVGPKDNIELRGAPAESLQRTYQPPPSVL